MFDNNRKIIRYKMFDSTEQFEKWQLLNDPTIIQISPVPVGLDGESIKKGKDEESFGSVVDLKVFVTYFLKIDVEYGYNESNDKKQEAQQNEA